MMNSKLLIVVVIALIAIQSSAQNCKPNTTECLECGQVDNVLRCLRCNREQSLDNSRTCVNCTRNCLNCQYNLTTRVQYCIDCVQGKKYNTIEYTCVEPEGKCDFQTCEKCINFYNNTQIQNLIEVYTPYSSIITQLGSTSPTPIEVCSQCKLGYELNQNNECVLTEEPPCPVQFYRDPTSRQCRACSTAISDCFQCTFGFHFNGTKQPICQLCNDGFFYNQAANNCSRAESQRPPILRCPRGCLTCSYGNQTLSCLTCVQGYSLDQAKSTCELNCSIIPKCQKCIDGPRAGEGLTCLECDRSAYPESGKCVTRGICTGGNYSDIEKKVCLECTPDCDVCDIQRVPGVKPSCLRCNKDFTVSELGACVKGKIPCPDGCSNCSVSELGVSICNDCLTNYTKNAQTNECVLNCPSGCSRCFIGPDRSILCSACTSPSQALNSSGLCANVSSVPCETSLGRYVNLLTTPGTCNPCPDTCGTCHMRGYNVWCLTCKSPNLRLLRSGRCVPIQNSSVGSICPEFTFNPQSTTCSPCNDANCQTCTSQFCNQCGLGYNLVNNVCYKREVVTKGCRAGCSECYFDERIKAQVCTKCINSNEWILDRLRGACLRSICSDREVFSLQTHNCMACPKNCLRCFLDIQGTPQCFSCQVGFNLANGTCQFSQAQCPDKTLADPESQQCLACPPGCSSCQFAANSKKIICNQCELTFQKKTDTSEYCQRTDCLNKSKILGFQKTELGMILACIDCNTGCTDCEYDFFDRRQVCSKCQDGFELSSAKICTVKDISTFTCAQDEIRYRDKDGVPRCAKCSTGCESCYYDEFKNLVLCKQCKDTFQLNQASLCELKNSTNSCGDLVTQFFNPETSKCENCNVQTNCLTCFYNTLSTSPKIACRTCPTNHTLNQQRCEINCPQFEVMQLDQDSKQTCVRCPISNCQNCRNNYLQGSVEIQCLACATGFFLQENRCVLFQSNCSEGSYGYLIRKDSQTQQIACGVCPKECKTCQSTNIYDQKAILNCTSCQETSQHNATTGTCIPKAIAQETECLAGQVYAFNKEKTRGACVSCPQSCRSCLGVLGEQENTTQTWCLSCQNRFFLDANGTCQSIPGCPSGQRRQLVRFTDSSRRLVINTTCVKCEQGCASCQIDDIYNESSYRCEQCIQNFLQRDGKCQFQVSEGNLNLSQINCDKEEGSYALLVRLSNNEITIVCRKCPQSCTACNAPINATQRTQGQLTCSRCREGFALNNQTGVCSQVCGLRNFFNSTTSRCQSCHQSCQTCSGPLETDCLTCTAGLTFNTNSKTCAAADNADRTRCLQGVGTFWDSQLSRCRCQRTTQVYNTTTGTCQEVFQNRTCGVGEYWGGSGCLQCAFMNREALCAVCTGPTTQDCVRCVRGYFFSKESRMCEKCSDQCISCPAGANLCEQCEPGSYMFRDGGKSSVCLSKCPIGTLPYSGSIYQLNTDIFTKEDTKEALQKAESLRRRTDFSKLVNETRKAIGIGEAMQPLFLTTEFSYQVDNLDVPSFQSQKIVVGCLPCVYNCFRECYSGYFWDDSAKQCLFEKCREGFRPNTVSNQCEQVNNDTFALKGVQIYSLDLATNAQPIDKTFFAEVQTTREDPTVKFMWSLSEVWSAGSALGEIDLQIVSKQFFTNVDTQSKSLKVPALNLQQGLTYVLVARVNATVSASTKFVVAAQEPARLSDGSRQIEDLGLRPSQMYVTPDTGVSGDTTFKAGWDFTGVDAFLRKGASGDERGWSFRIIVGDYFKFSSDNLNYQTEFVIPPISAASTRVRVQFIATRGTQRFTTELNIQVTGSNTTTNTVNSQLVQRAESPDLVKGLSYQELINAGVSLRTGIKEECPSPITEEQRLLLRTQGPCIPGQQSQCCAQGECVKGQVSRFVCKCKPGFEGSFCEFKKADIKDSTIQALKNIVDNLPKDEKLSLEQQNTILNVVKSTAETRVIENDVVVKLIENLEKLKTSTTDFDQLNAYLSALKEVKMQNFRIYQRDQNTNQSRRFLAAVEDGYKQREQNLKDQELKSIHTYLSSNLDSRRGEIELEFQFENLKGRAQIVRNIVDKHIQSISVPGSNDQAQQIQTTVAKDAFPTGDVENIVEFFATDSIISTAENASQILGGKNYEVSIFDAAKAERNISGLTGDCPIIVQIPVEKTGDPKTEISKSLLNCTFYDKVKNKYSTEGLKLLRIDETEKSYILNCCTNHLTSFAAIKLDSVTIGTETGSPRLVAVSALLLLSFFLAIFI